MKNNNKKLLLIVIGFVVLLGGASILYSSLSQSVSVDQLAQANPAPSAGTKEVVDEDATVQEDAQAGEAADQEAAGEEELMLAPDFTVYDAQGNEVKLSDYIGKPTVLNFWASWCGPCQMEMPDFHEKYLEIGEEVNFLMVNMTSGRETLENAQAFIEKEGYTFPVFFDTETDAAMTYSVYSLPTTYFLDAQGYLIANATGAIDADTLQRGIDLILPQS